MSNVDAVRIIPKVVGINVAREVYGLEHALGLLGLVIQRTRCDKYERRVDYSKSGGY